ncbi:MAG: HD domain-containing phosphohydrolase, partial [Solirubrobacteraceae bacterium]|nr:HD domain-containing phosphohydrolase [Solirubrobacteraceae bacterium]
MPRHQYGQLRVAVAEAITAGEPAAAVLHSETDPVSTLGAAVAGATAPHTLPPADVEAKLDERAADRAGLGEYDEVVDRLQRVAAFRDDDTANHSRRIGRAARILSDAMGLGTTFGALLENAAPLHDIGKVGIADAILLKPGRLTPEERTEMERHTTIGQEILSGGTSETVRMAAMIALSHHERWDGGGYPQGLAGDQTPIGARIVAVVDVFDALTHERPYKQAWPVCEAVAHIIAGAGAH